MKNNIFLDQLGKSPDTLETSSAPESGNIFLKQIPKTESKEMPYQGSRAKSLSAAPIKGLMEGLFEGASRLPTTPLFPMQKQAIKTVLEKHLPTKEAFPEEALRRGGKLFGESIPYGGVSPSNVIRSVVAGFGGEAVKEAGGSPLFQAITELVTLGFPGLSKIVSPTKAQKPLVDFARKMKLTEEELTPLIQGDKKLKFLGKLAKKQGKAQEALEKSRAATKKIYGDLGNSPLAQRPLTSEESTRFIEETHKLMENLPAKLRQEVMADYKDLFKKMQTGKANASDLMNLLTDLNFYIDKGLRQLGILKDPIEKSFERGYPGFNEDFTMTRELYKRFFPIAKKLRPGISEELLDAGEAGALIYGLAKGKFSILAELLGVNLARRLAREMLINPRLQNMHKQMVKALNENNIPAAQSIVNQIKASIPEQSEEQSGE